MKSSRNPPRASMGISDKCNWWGRLSENDFCNTFCMSKEKYNILRAIIDPLNEEDDNFDTNLLACLWVLGSTQPVEDVTMLFDLRSDTYDIMSRYFRRIVMLATDYVKWPTVTEMEIIEKEFNRDYGCPAIVGIIGTVYIDVSVNDDANSHLYYNSQTGQYAIVLQVVCDSNLMLRDVCVGCPASKSIEEILESSPLYIFLTNSDSVLVKHHKFLLGGSEHPELGNLLIPYKATEEKELSNEELDFNVVHNSFMTTIENTFICLQKRFPRITSVESFDVNLATLAVSAVCVLHNFTNTIHEDETAPVIS